MCSTLSSALSHPLSGRLCVIWCAASSMVGIFCKIACPDEVFLLSSVQFVWFTATQRMAQLQGLEFILICSTAFSFKWKALPPRCWWLDQPQTVREPPGVFLGSGCWRRSLPGLGNFPTVNWKCTCPLGKTKTSPLFRVVAKSLFAVLTNPAYRDGIETLPPQTGSRGGRGWMWGAFKHPLAKSRRAILMPSVWRPGNWAVNAWVIALPVATFRGRRSLWASLSLCPCKPNHLAE